MAKIGTFAIAFAIVIGTASATAIARDAFNVELPSALDDIIGTYELWLAAAGLRQHLLLAENVLPYWRHVFVLLLFAFALHAIAVSQSHGLARAAFAWVTALSLSLLGSVFGGMPPALPNVFLWPLVSVAFFFALQRVYVLVFGGARIGQQDRIP